MSESEWVVTRPKKMMIEPPPPPPAPEFSRWELFTYEVSMIPQRLIEFVNHYRTDPKVVDKTPIVTTFLLEAANVQQLWRMWTTQTAAGQSVTAWLSVNLALWLWLNFYFVFNRQNKFAIVGTSIGIGLNALVMLTVLYFRYVVGA